MRTLRFTLLAPLTLTMAMLSACAYLIPEEPNVPRNNTVLGPLRKPELNSTNGAPAPSDDYTPKPMKDNVYVPPVKSSDAPADAAPGAGSSDAQTMKTADSIGDRHMPVENTQYQMASSDYPPINSVPPRPALNGPGSSAERLESTQVELEKDRTSNLDSKKALDHDAAAEPSMLSAMPVTSPAPMQPIVSEPAPAVAPAIAIAPVSETKKVITPVPVPHSEAAPIAATPLASAGSVRFDPMSVPPLPPAAMSSVPDHRSVVFAVQPGEPAPAVPAKPMPAPLSVAAAPLPAPAPAIATAKPAPAPMMAAAPAAKPLTVAATPVISTTPTLPALPVFAPPAMSNHMAANMTPIDPANAPETFNVATTAPRATTATPAATAGVPTVRRGDFNPLAVATPPAAKPTNMALNQAATAPTLKKGDFDPLATAADAPAPTANANATYSANDFAYASSGSLGQSRYAGRY